MAFPSKWHPVEGARCCRMLSDAQTALQGCSPRRSNVPLQVSKAHPSLVMAGGARTSQCMM